MKRILFLIIGTVIGGIIVFFVMKNKMSQEFFIESKSKYGFEETVEQFETKIGNTKGWKIQHVYNLQKSMEKHGYKVLQVKVFSLCNPVHASKILFSNQEKVVSSMMPCRVSIYVKQDGQTYISRMNSGEMSVLIGGLVEEVMVKATNDIETIISEIIQ